jgi:hypothetical protein
MSMGNLAFAQLGSLRTQAGQALDAARPPAFTGPRPIADRWPTTRSSWRRPRRA